MADKSRRLNGDGTMRKRSDGRWEGRITIAIDPDTGKQKQRSIYARSQQELRKKMKEAREQLEQGEKSIENIQETEQLQITFGTWLDTWLTEYKKNSISPSTYVSYENAINNHIKPALGNTILQDLRPEQIQKFLNASQKAGARKDDKEGGLASWTLLKLKNIINNSLKQALRNRLIDRNPTDAIIPPKLQQKDIRILTNDEQSKFLKALDGHRLRAFFQLALASGMRRGELLALTWDGIDFANRSISIQHAVSRQKNLETGKTSLVFTDPKTRTGRRNIPMISSVVPILQQHYAEQQIEKSHVGSAYNPYNLVFCSNVGTFLEPRRINTTLEKLMKKAEVERINFHALRHTFATRALENGVPAKVVQEILGHADVTLTLNTYSHVLQSTAQEQLQKMDAIFSPKQEKQSNATAPRDKKKPKDRER